MMNKKDFPIFLLLLTLLFAWPYIYRRFIHKPAPVEDAPTQTISVVPRDETSPAEEAAEPPDAAPIEPALAAAEAPPEATPVVLEETAFLEDEQLLVTVSSRGGTITQLVLKEYFK